MVPVQPRRVFSKDDIKTFQCTLFSTGQCPRILR
jgi:hypothetical protein